MPTPYRSETTEAWCYTIPSDGWWFSQPITRTVQFYSVEAAEAYLRVTLQTEQE